MSDDWEGRHHDHSTEVDPSWAVAWAVMSDISDQETPTDQTVPTHRGLARLSRDEAHRLSVELVKHYPTTGMRASMGVTCQCGFHETRNLRRRSGNDGLDVHRAETAMSIPPSPERAILTDLIAELRAVTWSNANTAANRALDRAEDRLRKVTGTSELLARLAEERGPTDPNEVAEFDAALRNIESAHDHQQGWKEQSMSEESCRLADAGDWCWTHDSHFQPVCEEVASRDVRVILLDVIAELRDHAVYSSSESLAELADRAEALLKGVTDE